MEGYTFERKKLIKNYEVLSFEYSPPTLLHREVQMQQLLSRFKPVLQGLSRTAMLVGSVGTGKTATARLFCQRIVQDAALCNRNLACHIVNCRQKRTEHSILHSIDLQFNPLSPTRGMAQDDYLRSIIHHLNATNTDMILILDEADALPKKSLSDIVYSLTRASEAGGKSTISLILISQGPITDSLDEAASSTFRKSNVISFSRYTAAELKDIVQSRADLAYAPGTISEECVFMIANASSEWGDARFAIELLESSGLIAEEKNFDEVTPECVRTAKNMTYSHGSNEVRLSKMNTHMKLVLLAVCRSLSAEFYTTTATVKKAYEIASEEYGLKPKAETMFRKVLKDLIDEGWVGAEEVIDPNGRGGKTVHLGVYDFPIDEMKDILEKELSTQSDDFNTSE